MPRSLADLADELAPQYSDLAPPDRAAAIADALRTLRPDSDPGAVARAAGRAAGADPPAPARGVRPPRRPGRGRGYPPRRAHSPRRGGGRAGRRLSREAHRARGEVATVARVSSAGRVFRMGLYLTGLYWALRSAGALEAVVNLGQSAVGWLMDPAATITRRGATAASAPTTASAGHTDRPRPTR